MKYNIHITRAAEADLNSAVEYIDHILQNPQAADHLLLEAEEKIMDLAVFPEKYSLAEDPVLNIWGIRFTAVKNYLVFYTVSEEEKCIYIIRFLHSKQNWTAILGHGFSLE